MIFYHNIFGAENGSQTATNIVVVGVLVIIRFSKY